MPPRRGTGQEKAKLFLGTFIHSKALDRLEYLHDTAVCVDESGKIVAVKTLQPCDRSTAEGTLYGTLGWDGKRDEVEVHVSREGEFFFPGFVDAHVHASQYANVGLFGKSTLLDWLNTYTFPMEASMSSLTKARTVYTRCIRRTLSHGTTTAAYFATIHVASTDLLADLCLSLGQRALIGRVCMDGLAPDYYLDSSVEASMAATAACIAHIRSIDPQHALVCPILTPRFAPSCSSELLTRLGELQHATGLPVQTHISENEAELELVRRQFPDSSSYADVYDRRGLLGPRTILAHAVHLTDAEADLIARRSASVAHCPCSNSAINSGEARVRWLLDKGIRLGLGTDMSGGYSPSVLEAARLASLVSRHRAMPGKRHSHRDDDVGPVDGASSDRQAAAARERQRAPLSVEEVLYLATRGGADVVGLSHRIGAFEVGMEWDAQLIRLTAVPPDEDADRDGEEDEGDIGNVDIFGWESWEERVAKWLFSGDDRNTRKVWVRGRLVHARR